MTSAGRSFPLPNASNNPGSHPLNRLPAPAISLPVAAGMILLQAYFIIIFSRIVDVTIPGFKIPIINLLLILACAFASGTLFRFATIRVGFLMIVFTVWACVAAVFGLWKTGSLDSIQVITMSLVIGACIIALVTTPRAALRCMYTLGAASVIAGILGMLKGELREGRLVLSAGSFNDPNEYSSVLLMGLPCVLLYASRAQGIARKGIAYLSIIPLMLSFLRTGSRGGMIALMVYLTLVFFTSSFGQKVLMVSIISISFIAAVAILPDYLETRFSTIFSGPEVSVVDEELAGRLGADLGSTQGRWRVLVGSIELTFRHPLLGVGPGNFPSAFYEEEKQRGRRVGLNVTHNSYTQVSSETGIPGFLIFAAMLVLSAKTLRFIRKSAPPSGPTADFKELQDAARCLQRVLLIICSASFFLSMAYNPIFFVAIALAASFEPIARQILLSPDVVPAPATAAVNPLGPAFPPVIHKARR